MNEIACALLYITFADFLYHRSLRKSNDAGKSAKPKQYASEAKLTLFLIAFLVVLSSPQMPGQVSCSQLVVSSILISTTSPSVPLSGELSGQCSLCVQPAAWFSAPHSHAVIVIISLFTKLPCPGDNEGVFDTSCPVPICLPHAVEASHCPFCY